jgi:PilZ domain
MTSAELQRRLTAPGASMDLSTRSRHRTGAFTNDSGQATWNGCEVRASNTCAEVRVLDISAGGLLLETPQALKPNSSVVLELTGPDSPILVPSRVLRCRVASLSDILTYEGACAFRRPLTLPELTMKLTAETTPPAMPVEHTAETSIDWGKVVARFNDGSIVRGYTNDFDPSKAHMHISSDLRDGESTIILLSDLKALFFVREFAGNPMRADDKFFSQTPNGDRMEVTFLDNEVMVGSTQSYLAEGQGFFLQPADPRSKQSQRVRHCCGRAAHTLPFATAATNGSCATPTWTES